MASISFPTTASNMPGTTQATSATEATTTQADKTNTATTAQDDTVKISAAAQAKLLHQQGQSVTVIAASLGTTAKTVDDYLGITVTEALTAALKETEAATTKA